MENKLKILLLDNNGERLRSTTSLIHCCGDFCINPKSTINKYDYESNYYDVIFAHYGNKEVRDYIADDDWNSNGAIIIIFSGSLSKDKQIDDYGVWWISASYLEKKENICTLLREVIEK
jgi:hypothetical protein